MAQQRPASFRFREERRAAPNGSDRRQATSCKRGTMKRLMLLGTAVGMCAGISVARGQDTTSVSTAQPKSVMVADSVRSRPRARPHAIEYSNAYATRLTI